MNNIKQLFIFILYSFVFCPFIKNTLIITLFWFQIPNTKVDLFVVEQFLRTYFEELPLR